jgi:hypothetical protein
MTCFGRRARAQERKLPCAHSAHIGVDENFACLRHARERGRKNESSTRRKVHSRIAGR